MEPEMPSENVINPEKLHKRDEEGEEEIREDRLDGQQKQRLFGGEREILTKQKKSL